MAAPAHLALQLWPREGSIHPKYLTLERLSFTHCTASICVQGPNETRALRLMPTLRVNSGTGHCIGVVRDDALPLAEITNQALISDQRISASVAEVVLTNDCRASVHAMHKSGTSVGCFKPGRSSLRMRRSVAQSEICLRSVPPSKSCRASTFRINLSCWSVPIASRTPVTLCG